MNRILQSKEADARLGQIIKLAVMAVGGQGGGVLTGWIESMARAEGYHCQATSVAGVAQRTGATIYYVEMAPASDVVPVFSLAPAEGDVDIVVAAEMMEVGRAILRGFVTPDRTFLIGSTHRALAVSEKMVPGDGMANADEVRAAAELAAQGLILADMEALAIGEGGVISASLFGALAGSGALPFAREAFEEAIRRGGIGVEPSLRAFAAGVDAARAGVADPAKAASPKRREIVGPDGLMAEFAALETRIGDWPGEVQGIARAGLAKVVDFQDLEYGALYLDRLGSVVARDRAAREWALSVAGAKYLANAMAYDDILRVADLKTRAPRSLRIRGEAGAGDQNLVHVTEYFHPRAEEIAGLLPARMGARWEGSTRRMALLTRIFRKGRRLRTDRLFGFLLLNFLGGLKAYRLRTRRHAIESAHLEVWLQGALDVAAEDYALAVEILKIRRLIKGYSDTHARGHGKYARVMEMAASLSGREDAADWMRRLREAALMDEEGAALEGAIETVRSFL